MEVAYDIHHPCFLLQRLIYVFSIKRDFSNEVSV
jgi:hypothetical protein